jgi:hypothetical protein
MIRCGEEWKEIGWLSGTHAVPHPIRAYNLQPNVLFEACGVFDEDANRFKLQKDPSAETLTQTLFKATVVHTAGTAGWYLKYGELKGVGGAGFALPSMEEMPDYIDLLASFAVGGRRQGSMTPFNECLYFNSLMKKCKETIGKYEEFLTVVQTRLGDLMRDIENGKTEGKLKTREAWVEYIRDVLCKADGTSKKDFEKNHEFGASLIVDEVEEILATPFAQPSVVYYGYGGKRGISLLQSNKSTEGRRTRAESLLDYLKSIDNPHLLTCLGLVRMNGEVCVALNRRPITITDCDNIGCKMSVGQGKTTGSRLCIGEPAVNNIYDFPLYPAWRELEGGGMRILVFAEKAVSTYMERQKEIFHVMDPNFMLCQEEQTWPGMCMEMTSGTWIERRQMPLPQIKATRKKMMERRHRAGSRAVPTKRSRLGGKRRATNQGSRQR